MAPFDSNTNIHCSARLVILPARTVTTMRLKDQWVVVLLLGSLTCVAQQSATDKVSNVGAGKPVGSGIVSGRVYLSDMQGPARSATVRLQPAATLLIDDVPNILGQQTAGNSAIVEVKTRFDGSFSFGHVPAGDYYVMAFSPGYISPYLALAVAAGQHGYANQQPVTGSHQAATKAVLKGIPRISVESGQAATVEVILERGAAVSGNISYDDGTPAAGLRVEFLYRMVNDGKETWAEAPFLMLPGSGLDTSFTDDRGNYRISGLPAGKYVITTTFDLAESVSYIFSSSTGGGSSSGSSSNNRWTNFKIYSGNTHRLGDAAVLSLSLGEEYQGENLQFPLSKLHNIKGHIVSAHDGHVINSGQVTLYSSDDKSLAGYATISVDNDEFAFDFIYDGDYILTSPTSADVDYQSIPQSGSSLPPQYKSHLRHLYGAVSKPLHVDGNMDGVTIAAPEPTAKEAQMFKDALEKEQRRESAPPDNPQ
jgi:hypothetical protein